MQLVAYGAQDIYLTGNPMITYFKTIYRRHTNFAMEIIQQPFNGKPNFGKKLSAIVSRNGDLISGMVITATLPKLESSDNSIVLRWTDHVGHYLINNVEFEIGGQLIDKHYGDWLEIWSQLTVPAEKQLGYYELIGQDPTDALGRPTGLQKDLENSSIQGKTLFIPLQFWFCRNIGLSIPLISLKYHEVKINVEFSYIKELVRSGGIEIENISLDAELWVEYIYLDDEERRRFANSMHEYLIEQLQYNHELINVSNSRDKPSTHYIPLNLSHPVKELIWVVQPLQYRSGSDRQAANFTAVQARSPLDNETVDSISGLEHGLSSITNNTILRDITNQSCIKPSGARNPVVSAKVQLNGHDRISNRYGTYFNWVQCHQHHTCIPKSPGINVYSFSILPERHQPSGTCNFSRIDTAFIIINAATLQSNTANPHYEYPGLGSINPLSSGNCECRVYAVNYNVLRIMHGMGGLAYRH